MQWHEHVKSFINPKIKRPEGNGLPFIGEHALREAWEEAFKNDGDPNIEWYDGILLAKERIMQSAEGGRLLQVASILVNIGWEEWGTFQQSFVEVPERSDADLPFDSIALSGVAGLDIDRFCEHQYGFLSPLLQERYHHRVTSLHRLPFIQRQALSPSNRVVKVRVAEGYCSYAEYGSLKMDRDMAKKQCGDEDEYWTEYEIFKTIRENQNRNARIIRLFCTLQVDHQFSFLLEYADGADLHNRLFHNVNALECYRKDMHANDDGSLINRWCTTNEGATLIPVTPNFQRMLIKEAGNLAHALNYLHTRTIKGQMCYHMDIKPQNILVFFRRCEENEVGQWKIADFGVSVFHAVRNGNPFSLGETTSRTVPRRPRGYFTPPEADDDNPDPARRQGVNDKGDIWSLGWILCMVLAYSLGGPEAVKDFWKLRNPSTGGNSRNNLFYDFRARPPVGAADSNIGITGPNAPRPEAGSDQNSTGPYMQPFIKPRVRNWFNDLRLEHSESPWVSAVLFVIEHCVMIAPENRATAEDVYHALHEIVAAMEQDQPSYEYVIQAFHTRYSSSRHGRYGSLTSPNARDARSFHNTSPNNDVHANALIPSMPATGGGIYRRDLVPDASAIQTNVRHSHNQRQMLPESGSSSGQNLTTVSSSSNTSQSLSLSSPVLSTSSSRDQAFHPLNVSDIDDIAICPLTGRVIAINKQASYMFEPFGQTMRDVAYFKFRLNERLWTNTQIRGLYLLLQNSNTGQFKTFLVDRVEDPDSALTKTELPATNINGLPLPGQVAISQQGLTAVAEDIYVRIHESLPLEPLPYPNDGTNGQPRGSERFHLLQFNHTGDVLLACGILHYYLWDTPTSARSLEATKNPYPPGIGKYSKRFQIIAPRFGKGFLIHDRGGKRIFSLGAIREDIREVDMLCGTISPDNQSLYYVRMMKRKKDKKYALALFKRALLNGVIGEEESFSPHLGLNCEKNNTHVWMASHELVDCSVLIVATSHGQLNIVPIPCGRSFSISS